MIIIVVHQNKLTKLLLTIPWSCSAGGWGSSGLSKMVHSFDLKNTGDEAAGWEVGDAGDGWTIPEAEKGKIL